MTTDALPRFVRELSIDLRLLDAMADRTLSVTRRALAAASLGQDVDEAWVLAQELADALWMADRDIVEGLEWLEHIRATSRYDYQRALMHIALMGPKRERAKDLGWLVYELKLRRRLLAIARENGAPGPSLRPPLMPVPFWNGVGQSPLSVPFVPSGWTAEEWACGGLAEFEEAQREGALDLGNDLTPFEDPGEPGDDIEDDDPDNSAWRFHGGNPFDPQP